MDPDLVKLILFILKLRLLNKVGKPTGILIFAKIINPGEIDKVKIGNNHFSAYAGLSLQFYGKGRRKGAYSKG